MVKLLLTALVVLLVACEQAAPPKPAVDPAPAPPAAAPEPDPEPASPTPAPSSPPPPAVDPAPTPPPVSDEPPVGTSATYHPPTWLTGTWRGMYGSTGLRIEITRSAIRFIGRNPQDPDNDLVIRASDIYQQFVSTQVTGFTVFRRLGSESEALQFVIVNGRLGTCAQVSVNGVYPPVSECTIYFWQR